MATAHQDGLRQSCHLTWVSSEKLQFADFTVQMRQEVTTHQKETKIASADSLVIMVESFKSGPRVRCDTSDKTSARSYKSMMCHPVMASVASRATGFRSLG